MEKVKLYNQDGNVAGELAMPEFLSLPWNVHLAHQVFKAIAANKRRPIAHTKDRSEVSGGGIKPWKQKGTGRARHGSIRSPIWRHGGVTFGPRNTTDFSQGINKKMMKEAVRGALAAKLVAEELKVVEKLEAKDLKTKNLAKAINNLSAGKSTLLVVSAEDKNILRAASNIANLTGVLANNLNAHDVLSHKYVLMEQKAFNELTAAKK
jgi:large subunit ribosomal protein L4